MSVALRAFGDEVTELTDDAIRFEYFYAGALVPGPEHATATADGIVDVSMVVPA